MMNKLMSVEEVAEVLGVSLQTVYSWASKGRLPIVKVGRRTMFDPAEIRRWLAERSRHEGSGDRPAA